MYFGLSARGASALRSNGEAGQGTPLRRFKGVEKIMAVETVSVMRMGELARRSGLKSQTVHYYLRRGYLHPPLIKDGNQAFYDETHLERLRLLKKCKRKNIPFAFCDQLEEIESAPAKRAGGTLEVRTDKGRGAGAARSTSGGRAVGWPGGTSTTRDRIIDVGSRVFLQRGYRGTTITEIMNRVGLTKATFYYYFENKKDLYFACLDRVFDTIFVEALEKIKQEEDPLKRFELRMRSSRLFLAEMITILDLIKESLRDEDDDHRQQAADVLRKALVDPLTRDVQRGMRKGVFRKVNSEVVGYIIVSVLETIAYRPMISEKITEAEIEDIMLDFIFHALTVDDGDTRGMDTPGLTP